MDGQIYYTLLYGHMECGVWSVECGVWSVWSAAVQCPVCSVWFLCVFNFRIALLFSKRNYILFFHSILDQESDIWLWDRCHTSGLRHVVTHLENNHFHSFIHSFISSIIHVQLVLILQPLDNHWIVQLHFAFAHDVSDWINFRFNFP